MMEIVAEIIDRLVLVITTTATVLVSYQVLLLIVGAFGKARVWPETEERSSYAILIPARNEEGVIANLVESIKKQNYPQDKVTVFVIADDC